jgi:hypothetical protein
LGAVPAIVGGVERRLNPARGAAVIGELGGVGQRVDRGLRRAAGPLAVIADAPADPSAARAQAIAQHSWCCGRPATASTELVAVTADRTPVARDAGLVLAGWWCWRGRRCWRNLVLATARSSRSWSGQLRAPAPRLSSKRESRMSAAISRLRCVGAGVARRGGAVGAVHAAHESSGGVARATFGRSPASAMFRKGRRSPVRCPVRSLVLWAP